MLFARICLKKPARLIELLDLASGTQQGWVPELLHDCKWFAFSGKFNFRGNYHSALSGVSQDVGKFRRDLYKYSHSGFLDNIPQGSQNQFSITDSESLNVKLHYSCCRFIRI